MCAAEHGHTECVKLLLQSEWVGDLDVQDDVRICLIAHSLFAYLKTLPLN